LIEDAAEVIGQKYYDKQCGSFGEVSTFSFYPNKHITTGEGGMVLTDCPNIADKARELRNLCFNQRRRFVHDRLGWNLRMTNMQAALGLAQLEQLDDFIEKKHHIGSKYHEILKNTFGLRLPVEKTSYSKNIYWVFGIVLEKNISMNACEAMSKLNDLGVGCRPFFYPLHKQPFLSSYGIEINEKFLNSEYISTNGFYIPSGLALTDYEIERVASALIKILN
jgi:perosamine synthetase